MPPTTGQPDAGQLALLLGAILLLLAGGAASVARAKWDREQLRWVSRGSLVGAILLNICLLAWRAAGRERWLPLDDNVDALLWLATLLGLFVLYVQWNRPLGGLDWFVMPLVIVMLIAAGFFGEHRFRSYVTDTWTWVHYLTAFGGAVGFAIAAAAGASYVVTVRRLRRHGPMGTSFGSLERLEHLTMGAVTIGFALLTIGMITGGVKLIGEGKHTSTAKVILSVGVWVVYAIVLHAPVNPRFRGRKVAMLSILGFALMLGVLLTVLLVPSAMH